MTSSTSAMLGRLYWMMAGPMILFVATVVIALDGNGWFTVADRVFLAALLGLGFARWIEFRGGQPQTSTGEPAQAGDLQRYVLGTLASGLGVWIAANLVGNYGL